MSRGIVKLAEDEYVEWSTVVDAPVSYIMTRSEALEQFRIARIERADLRGTSYLDQSESLESFLDFNRAGPEERCLTLEEIRVQYKLNERE